MERVKQIKQLWSKRPFLSRLWMVLLLLLVCTVEIQSLLKSSPATQDRKIAAKRDLRAGLVLTVHDLTVAPGDKYSSDEPDGFVEQELHQILGARLLQDVSSGTVIVKSQVQLKNSLQFSHKVPKGMRAFLIRTQSKLPLEPGDRVDVLGRTKEGHPSSQLLVEDRKVLAVSRKEDHEELLVALSPNDIGKMGSNQGSPWVDVVLRNPFDSSKERHSKPSIKTKIQILDEENQ